MSDTTATSHAVYLMGHGFFKEPRLIELQYFRITRYIEAHGHHGVAPSDVFTDLSSRSSSSGPQTIEELPALINLLERIRAKAYNLVFIDVEHGSFGFDPVALIRPHLERAGAKVLNVFYDDEKILERALKERFGKEALIDDLTDGSDFVCFFPALASTIATAALRRELQAENLEEVRRRLDSLKELRPYAGGRRPFIEDGLSRWWRSKEG